MPRLAQSGSEEELDMHMSGVRQSVAQATPTSGHSGTFMSKADLMNGYHRG